MDCLERGKFKNGQKVLLCFFNVLSSCQGEYLGIGECRPTRFKNTFLSTNCHKLWKMLNSDKVSAKNTRGKFRVALSLDGCDLSLDYKLSGPLLANLPNPRNPAVFLPNLWPLENELAIRKTSCSVFKSTNIDYVLRNCHVEQLILCGQITNQCVELA